MLVLLVTEAVLVLLLLLLVTEAVLELLLVTEAVLLLVAEAVPYGAWALRRALGCSVVPNCGSTAATVH